MSSHEYDVVPVAAESHEITMNDAAAEAAAAAITEKPKQAHGSKPKKKVKTKTICEHGTRKTQCVACYENGEMRRGGGGGGGGGGKRGCVFVNYLDLGLLLLGLSNFFF